MSRNLCTSSCCNHVLRLSDMRGMPIEFRRYSDEHPVIGTRWDCPECGTAYFAWWRDGQYNAEGFVLDLSYYESFNDEHAQVIDLENPWHLCMDDAEDSQWVW